MEKCSPCKTPIVTREAEIKSKNSNKIASFGKLKPIPFREAIGSLLFLANGTRPDITFAVNYCSRMQSSFTNYDWKYVQRILRYLKGTCELGLCYRGHEESIHVYPDASLGTNEPDAKSTSGFVIKVFGDIIHWRTKKQGHVAVSTAEAEYVSMSLAVREVTAIRAMCDRLLDYSVTPIIFEDNKAAISMAKANVSSGLTHLVHNHFHYVRDEVKLQNIEIQWIDTKNQLGDLFTKALPESKFCEFRSKMLSNIGT